MITHRLKVDHMKKVFQQWKRRFVREKSNIIKNKVKSLKKNGWVKEVDNLIWLSNVVLANKAWSDHRMCIDFTNVNFATPKYCFYIPNIDQLVDDIPGFKVIYFMDAC